MSPRDRSHRSFSTHKRRSLWFRESTSWPHRELRAEEVAEIAKAPALSTGRGAPKWKSVGPTNVAGRMTSVVAHPRNPERVLAGAAGGGVWRWRGEAGRWTPASEGLDTLIIGSLARSADRKSPVVYCGTGEANLSGDSHPGMGLYRSTDWGKNWTCVATPQREGIPGRIGAIAVNPCDANCVLIGGVGHRYHPADASGGLLASTDAGATWNAVTAISSAPYWCHSIVFDSQGTAYAAVTERGTRSGIWSSVDGTKWDQLWDGLPPAETIHRTSLAVSPSDWHYVYALCADRRGGVLGVYQSRDGGASWREIGQGHFRNERNMSYNNAIAVHPTKPDRVLCAGVDLHLWDGVEWRQVTSWESRHSNRDVPHADHHALLMPDGDLVYDLNDGGMAISTNGGYAWADRSAGLVTTTFYDLDVAPSDRKGKAMGGGTQDNGTLVTLAGPDGFHDVTGGDGGWMAFDPTRANRFFSTVYDAEVNLHYDHPNAFPVNVSPPEAQWIRDQVFLTQLRLEPDRSDVVYVGTLGVWRSEPAPTQEISWKHLVDDLDGSVVTALEIAPADPRVLYGGTENGGVFLSRDRGESWSGDLASRVLPGSIITRIRTHPAKAEELLLCVGRVGHGHVFRSRDWGRTWEDVSGKLPTALPDVPFRALAVDLAHPGVVYAGSDAGVYVSKDFGDMWELFSGDLPRVAVTDLVIHEKSRQLFAATYGRGIWSTNLPR